MTTQGRILLAGAVAAALVGGAVVLAPTGLQLGDGGTVLLPDGGSFDGSVFAYVLGADAAVPLNCPAGGWCTVVTSAGYQETQVVWTDGGPIYSSSRAFSCSCASDAGPCLFSDGGQVGAGTYPSAQVSGAGCKARPCVELSSSAAGEFSGAPPGCAP